MLHEIFFVRSPTLPEQGWKSRCVEPKASCSHDPNSLTKRSKKLYPPKNWRNMPAPKFPKEKSLWQKWIETSPKKPKVFSTKNYLKKFYQGSPKRHSPPTTIWRKKCVSSGNFLTNKVKKKFKSMNFRRDFLHRKSWTIDKSFSGKMCDLDLKTLRNRKNEILISNS